MRKLFSLFLLFLSVHGYAQKDSLLKPTANINGLTKGEMTLPQLRNAKKISVSVTDWVIVSYKLTVYGRGKTALVTEIHSNIISEEYREAIAKFPTGSKIYFEYIKAEDIHRNELLLPPLGFVLKK